MASTAQRALLDLQVSTASPAQLIVLLYRGAEQNLIRMLRAWERLATPGLPWERERQAVEEASAAAQKALDILSYLLAILDGSQPGTADFARSMEALYIRWIQVLTAAGARRDADAIRTILSEIRTVRSGWESAAGGGSAESG